MRRIKTEATIIGTGGAAMLAASRLAGQGMRIAVINPANEFGVDDLRPHHGLGLWHAAYRLEGSASLSELHDSLAARLREVFPSTLDNSGLRRVESWSVLSSTPIHREVTEELEREFFRLERKSWSTSHFRLVNPEHVLARMRKFGLDLTRVAQVEGGVVRNYGLWWDAPRMGYYLAQFMAAKFAPATSAGGGAAGGLDCLVGAQIEGRYGRKVVLSTRDGEEVSVEADRGLFIFLTGDLLPYVKSIVAACDEPWIQGVRKRRREQHFALFERNIEEAGEEIWMDLGHTRYRWSARGGAATWRSTKGPDGLERVIDEGLRLQCIPHDRPTRFTHSSRGFRLEWEWKNPQWRETSHQTHWATSFEGDLWNTMELLWTSPHH
jgi:hypothetical protein